MRDTYITRFKRPHDQGSRANAIGLRALLTLLLVGAIAPVGGAAELASPAAEQGGARWRAVATAPRPNLPAVEIALGYPGQYLAMENSPIELRARSGEAPFDGYLGYHVAVSAARHATERILTNDVPVVSRASLAPHSAWTFSSWLRVSSFDRAPVSAANTRELVIEWRDHNMKLIAERSVGVPPWAPASRPLRVVGRDETNVDPSYLDTEALLLPARELPATVQWYAGFPALIVPLEVWLQLPAPVREAVFRSDVLVYFFGVPDRLPQMTNTDRALLPVELESAASVLSIPWPYAAEAGAAQQVPLSWRPKKGTRVLGTNRSPYVTISPISVYAADESALRTRLPRFALSRRETPPQPRKGRKLSPTLSEIVHEFRPLLVVVVLAILSVTAWMAFRRRAHWIVLALAAAVAVLTVAARNQIRTAGGAVAEEVRLASPDVWEAATFRRDFGAVPLRVDAADAAKALDSVTRSTRSTNSYVEVRGARTAPGFGDLYANKAWESSSRQMRRRELGSPATIDIVSASAERLVVRYSARAAVSHVVADWTFDGRRYYGTAHGTRSTSGEVTIEAYASCPMLYFDPSSHDIDMPDNVTLLLTERGRTVAITTDALVNKSAATTPYVFIAAPRRKGDELISSVVLPGPVPSAANVTARLTASPVTTLQNLSAVRLAGPGGSVSVPRVDRRSPNIEIATSELQRIAPNGGVVQVHVETQGLPAEVTTAVFVLRVREKEQ